MKKIYAFLAAALFTLSATAQTKNIDIETTLINPANGATVTIGTPFAFTIQFKNKGTGTIVPTDTLLFAFTGSSSTYFITGRSKAPNDTISLNTQLTFTGGTPGAINFCVAGVMGNSYITDTDTSNNRNCHSITLAGSSNGVADLRAVMEQRPEQLNVFPNPATNTLNLDYTARNNSEVVARVFDIAGREVLNYNFGKAYTGKKGFALDLTSLNTGMYFIELRQDGVRAMGKVNKR